MHIIRMEIYSWVHFFTSRGHPRSSYGVKKGHLGSKIGNMAKCTWYAYHSIGNFLLNPMICISRSSEVILRGQKRSFGVENRKYGQMHMICIPFDWKFSSEFNDVTHLMGHKFFFIFLWRTLNHDCPYRLSIIDVKAKLPSGHWCTGTMREIVESSWTIPMRYIGMKLKCQSVWGYVG